MNLVNNAQQFTYVSDMNGSNSTMDHFFITNNLLNDANLSNGKDYVDNQASNDTTYTRWSTYSGLVTRGVNCVDTSRPQLR